MKLPYARAFVAFSVSIAIFVGYAVWYAAVANKSAAVASLESRIAAKTETASRIASARSALSGIAGDEDVVQNYFVPETGVVSFINSLEAHGKALESSVSVLSVSTEEQETRPMLLLALSIEGTFDAVLRTVGTIEYAPYDLFVSEFSIGQNAKNKWRADLKIRVGSIKTNMPLTP